MPIVSTSIKLDGTPCVINSAEYQALGAARKANGYWCPVGPMPGRAWLLMLRSAVAAIANGSAHTLTFAQGTSSAALTGLYFDKAERLSTGGTGEADAVYLAEFVDVRGIAQKFSDTGTLNLNCRTYAWSSAHFSSTIGFGGPKSWQELVTAIWNTLPSVMGTAPTLPYSPHGTPEDIRFWGQNSWDALHQVLEKLNCTTAYNPISGTFSYVQLGDTQSLPSSGLGTPLWDGEPFDANALDIPETIRVYFPVNYKSYGQERDVEPSSNWTVEPDAAVYKIDTATGVSGVVTGTVLSLWDDLPRLLDENNSVTNASALTARAAERTAKWVTEHQADMLHRVYAGPLATILPGAQNKAVFWHHWGDGHNCVTEVLRNKTLPSGYDEGRTLWLPGDKFRAPDVMRLSYPNFPRLPNVVEVYSLDGTDGLTGSELPAGTPIEPNASGLFPARVRRWVAGALAELDTCWLRMAPDNPSYLPNGYCVTARLSGMETHSGTQRPIYIAGLMGEEKVTFSVTGSFEELRTDGPLTSDCTWDTYIGSAQAEIDGGDDTKIIINRAGVYQVSYSRSIAIDPNFTTLNDDNVLHWSIRAFLNVNSHQSADSAFYFDKYYYYRFDDVYPTGADTGDNEIKMASPQITLQDIFFLRISNAMLPYDVSADIGVTFLLQEDNGTDVAVFSTNPDFVLDFERIDDYDP